MVCSKDVQYFQLDEQGNMFVYKPASGFSGPAIKLNQVLK